MTDLALVSLGELHTLQSGDLQYRHKSRPFVGRAFRGKVVRTVVRGHTIFREGRIFSRPVVRFVRSEPENRKQKSREDRKP